MMHRIHAHPTRRSILATWVLGVTALLPAAALASDGGSADSVSFEVTVIEGSKGDAVRIDPQLEPLRKELEKLVPFRVFRLVNTQTLTLRAGEKRPVKLPDGSDAEVQVAEILPGPPKKVRYALRLQHSRQTRVAAKGARFVDAIPAGDKVLAVSISVQ